MTIMMPIAAAGMPSANNHLLVYDSFGMAHCNATTQATAYNTGVSQTCKAIGNKARQCTHTYLWGRNVDAKIKDGHHPEKADEYCGHTHIHTQCIEGMANKSDHGW